MAPATSRGEEGEDALPIDIVYTKLLDWLLERKKVSPKWHDSLRSIRTQIDQALGELQAGDESVQISMWLKGKDLSQIHYYNCRRIMDILLCTQSGRVKNIFGQFTNTLLKQWNAILKAYEKDNIYLGEAARLLQQQTHYCTQILRKRISDGENEVMECEQGVLECGKKVKDLQKKFVQLCEELLGVPVDGKAFFFSSSPGNEEEGGGREKSEKSGGIDFHALLREAWVRELPPLFEEVENLLKEDVIGEAMNYHLEMRQFLHSYVEKEGKEKEVGGEREGEGGGEETFPLLRKVRRGERLVVVDTGLPVQGGKEEGEEEEEGEINWGDDAGEGEGEGAEIDWDIAVVDNDTAATAAAPSSSPPSSKPPSTAAAATTTDTTTNNTDSLLADPTYRTHLLNDLLELEAFLRHRRLELSDEATNNAFTGQYQGQHAALQQQSSRTIERYLGTVTHTLTKLRAKRLQQLLAMRASPVYVDRVVSGLEQRLLHIEKLQRTITHTQARREEALACLGKARPEYEATAAAIKSLKEQVERSMSDLFKGRGIHIIGEINTL